MKLSQKIDFQQKLLGKIEAAKRRAYRSSVIAEMTFETTSQNPPHIHTVVKNYQDLFEKSEDKSIRRNHLIYQDDKKIYGLSVRYHFGDSKPRIRACFAPFRNFLLDLDLANDIISRDYSFKTECYDLKEQLDEIQGRRQSNGYDDSLEKLRNFINNKEMFVQTFGEEAYNSMLLSHRMSAQEYLLGNFGLGVRDLYLFYMPLIIEQKFGRKITVSNKKLENIPAITSEWIAASPIRIQLPNAPLEDGDTKIFKRDIRASLSAFHQKHLIFKPLHIPVNLNILYKPPKKSNPDYNDLDNIMRKIVPAFNEIFKPPSTHTSHVNIDGIKDKKLCNSLRKIQERIPKSIRTSVSGYDIFKMPRAPEDDSEGYLTASFSSGTSSLSSPIFIIDQIIDKWIECCEDMMGQVGSRGH